jgi:hypothetical protein
MQTATVAEPIDADLVDGILVALRSGLVDVARVLGAELEERRRARAPRNVVEIRARRRRD